jgi:altronate dehydratase large subunit
MDESKGLGFRRRDGAVGVRNHLLIVPTVLCANVVCRRIESAVTGSVALSHQGGCGQLGPDKETTFKTLLAYCTHPNVGGVLVVALGCEQIGGARLVDAAKAAGKHAALVGIQQAGGTLRAIEQGVALGRDISELLVKEERTEIDFTDLTVALKCGGSDYTSGLASNPVLGRFSDHFTSLGGATLLSETAEIMGAEHTLAARAQSPEVKRRLFTIVNQVESQAKALGLDIRGTQPSPGNIRGGLSSIEEKSLGSAQKGGTRSVLRAVIGYADPVTERGGLTMMDTTGLDVESVTGMVAGGAQLVLFTTGLGTPTGNPIAPVIKVTANPKTAASMADNTDFDCSPVLSGEESLDAAAQRLNDYTRSVAFGVKTSAEQLGHTEFAIARLNPTI